MQKKICFFDIDGTIWDYDNILPDSTAEAIRRLRANGHMAFLCSGRSKAHIISEELLSVGFDGIVCGCGTHVMYGNETRFLHEIPNDLLIRTLGILERYEFQPILEGKDYLYFDLDYFGSDWYGQKLLKELGETYHRTIRGEWGRWHASKFSCDTKKGHVEECFEALKEHFHFLVHSPGVVEVVPRGFDKKTGVEWVMRDLGAAREDIIAFGDSTNDIQMLKFAGTGVAMGNGSDAAKAAADLVTTDLKDNGIYNACKKLGLM